MPEGTEAFAGGYRIIRPDEPLSPEFRDQYWRHVREALREVFQADETKADQARERLEDLEARGRGPQTIFYHADPLAVAADLAGRKGKPISAEQKVQYQGLLKRWGMLGRSGQPAADQLGAVHPED
jgi:hypothetical protein